MLKNTVALYSLSAQTLVGSKHLLQYQQGKRPAVELISLLPQTSPWQTLLLQFQLLLSSNTAFPLQYPKVSKSDCFPSESEK